MNYIWYPLIEAIQLGCDTAKICYRVADRKFHYDVGDEIIHYSAGAHNVSPFLEYMPIVLYDPDKRVDSVEKFSRADVNPYHRFGSIFNNILSAERSDPNFLIVCDIITHILAHVDRICGMCKHDFRIMLIMNEISEGCFGDTEAFELFTVAEKRAFAEALIMLYETSNSLRCLDNLFNMMMTDFNILLRDNVEVVFYNPYMFNEREDKMLGFIIKVFMPVDFPYAIHWRCTYGTIGLEESMLLDNFVL